MQTSYSVIQRTTRGTSLHECEELEELLNTYAAKGWKLIQILDMGRHQNLILERQDDRKA